MIGLTVGKEGSYSRTLPNELVLSTLAHHHSQPQVLVELLRTFLIIVLGVQLI